MQGLRSSSVAIPIRKQRNLLHADDDALVRILLLSFPVQLRLTSVLWVPNLCAPCARPCPAVPILLLLAEAGLTRAASCSADTAARADAPVVTQ